MEWKHTVQLDHFDVFLISDMCQLSNYMRAKTETKV